MSSISSSRQRVTVACVSCRTKRSRCDGLLPECGPCVLSGRHCHYQLASDKRKPPSRRYVEALQARILSLEKSLLRYQQADLASNPQIHLQPGLPKAKDDDIDTSGLGFDRAEAGRISPSAGGKLPRELVKELANVDGRLDVSEDGHLRYYGASSYFNLLRQPHDGVHIVRSLTTTSRRRFSTEAPIVLNIPTELSSHLLELFWTWQHPWHHVVHKPAIVRALQRGTYDDYCTPLLLQALLVNGSIHSERYELLSDPSDPHSRGDDFLSTAKHMLTEDLDHATVSTVVSLLLLGIRECDANKEAMHYLYFGMAVRIAYNLGLNHDCTKWIAEGRITAEEAEIRNIAWWGCYMHDRFSMVGLGRPGIIQPRDNAVPQPALLCETEFTPWSYVNDRKNISFPYCYCVSTFRHTCEFFETASVSLDELYAVNSTLSFEQKRELTIAVHVRLESSYNKLPTHLKMPHSMRTAATPHVYSLHLLYHTLVILVHRPFLRKTRRNEDTGTLSSPHEAMHNHACTLSAEAITNIMKSHRTHYGPTKHHVTTPHALGIASTIHFMNAMSVDLDVSRTALRHLKANFTYLRELGTSMKWATRAIRYLQRLAEEWSLAEILTSNTRARQEDSVTVLRSADRANSAGEAADLDATLASAMSNSFMEMFDDWNWLTDITGEPIDDAGPTSNTFDPSMAGFGNWGEIDSFAGDSDEFMLSQMFDANYWSFNFA